MANNVVIIIIRVSGGTVLKQNQMYSDSNSIFPRTLLGYYAEGITLIIMIRHSLLRKMGVLYLAFNYVQNLKKSELSTQYILL